MIKIFLFTIILFAADLVFAENIYSQSERGPFSGGFYLGVDQARMLNQDSSYAGYAGSIYGGSLDVKLWSSGIGEFRIFGEISEGTRKGSTAAKDKAQISESIYGLKMYANPYVFLAVGKGTLKQNVTNAVSPLDADIKSNLVAVGMGFDYPIGKSWFVSLQGWYKAGPILKSENASLSSNSYFETGQLHLQFIWSPPMTTITYTSKQNGL